MSKIAYILEKDLDKYVGLQEVSKLNSISDVATLLEVYEKTVEDIDYRRIKYIVKDKEDYFYCVISEDYSNTFDLFSFIGNSRDEKFSSISIKYIFPISESRGIYEGNLNEELELDDEDEATSYLDEDDLDLPLNKEYKLYYVRMGVNISITNKGVIMGRSPKKVDFIIRGNSNIGRVHCNVYVNKDGNLMVHDFNSLNGTFVNNKKVHSSDDVRLVEGDTLLLADEEFRVI